VHNFNFLAYEQFYFPHEHFLELLGSHPIEDQRLFDVSVKKIKKEAAGRHRLFDVSVKKIKEKEEAGHTD
jgi:hypothetical protein